MACRHRRGDHILSKVSAVSSEVIGCFSAGIDSMPTEAFKRRLAAIVATDVVDYSRLMGQDEAGHHLRVKKQRKTINYEQNIVGKGREVKRQRHGMAM